MSHLLMYMDPIRQLSKIVELQMADKKGKMSSVEDEFLNRLSRELT